MSHHPEFHELMKEYMKKNFDELMNMKDDKNSLFNMMIAHLIMNWDNNTKQNIPMTNPELDDIIQYLDKVLLENKNMFEETLQLLKDDRAED